MLLCSGTKVIIQDLLQKLLISSITEHVVEIFWTGKFVGWLNEHSLWSCWVWWSCHTSQMLTILYRDFHIIWIIYKHDLTVTGMWVSWKCHGKHIVSIVLPHFLGLWAIAWLRVTWWTILKNLVPAKVTLTLTELKLPHLKLYDALMQFRDVV